MVYADMSRAISRCWQKIFFASEAVAIKTAAKMQAKHKKHTEHYKCLYCDGWHLTTQNRGALNGPSDPPDQRRVS